MQTFAGLWDSSLPDLGLAPTHYGTTKVTINHQYMEKLSTTLSVGKRSDPYATHTGAATSSYDTFTLTVSKHSSHWRL